MSISWRLVKKSYIIATQWKSWYRTMDHNVNIQLLPLKYLYNHKLIDYSSAQLSRSVASDSLRHLGPQHTRPPCPSPASGVDSNSCPLSRWCHPTILSHRPFRIRWPKYWSFSFNISPSNEHSGLISFRMDWLDLLESKGLSRSSPTPSLDLVTSKIIFYFCFI